MSKTSDVLYGRQGGRFVPPAPAVHHRAAVLPMPVTDDDLRDHLIVEHGIPSTTANTQTRHEMERVHGVEHRTRHPKELHHEHPASAMSAMGAKVDEVPDPAASTSRHPNRAICQVCRRPFVHAPKTSPDTCGSIRCRAMTTWGPDEWAGQARMARARQAAGIPLTDLDRASLTRSAVAA